MSKNSEKKINDFHLLWHKKFGRKPWLELENPDALFEDAGGCQGEGMILRVEVGKHKIYDLTFSVS